MSDLIHDHLESIGIGGLPIMLQRTGSFIAGSYSIPFQQLTLGMDVSDDRDIDIWIPDGSDQTRAVADLVQYFVHHGYEWPSTHAVRNSGETEMASYRRMERSIKRMYTLWGPVEGLPVVQLLILHPEAGSRPEDVVQNFDLTLLKRWYDGESLTILPDAADAIRERILRINSSEDIKNQTLAEWIRTVRRLRKYTERNFEIQWQTDPLDAILLEAVANEIYKPQTRLLELHRMERWNMLIRALGDHLPFLAVTVCPPSRTLSDLRIVRTMNSRLFMDPSPRLHWSELTPQEQRSAVPIRIPIDHKHHRVIGVKRIQPGDLPLDSLRTIPAVFQREHVATLVPFPVFEVLSPRMIGSTTMVLSISMGEELEESVYLGMNPKDHVIILDPSGNKYGLARSQLLQTQKYMACPTPDSMNLQEVVRTGFIVHVPLSYNVYVPHDQFVAALRSPFVYFGVRRMNISFDYTASTETLRGDTYVGADHCQTGTDKQIWQMYAIPTK